MLYKRWVCDGSRVISGTHDHGCFKHQYCRHHSLKPIRPDGWEYYTVYETLYLICPRCVVLLEQTIKEDEDRLAVLKEVNGVTP
jgi:hypothetical protein